MPGLDRLFYVDDSYRQESGLVVFGWIECNPVEWRRGLRAWLELRKDLRREFGVRVDKELHATEFVNGRGDLSDDHRPLVGTPFVDGQAQVLRKDLGRAVAVRCLQLIGSCPFLQVGAVWRHIPDDADFTAQKYELYADFVQHIDAELRGRDSYGLIVMDGQDPHYRSAHRALKLDERHIVEDAIMSDSGNSQLVQMADLVAYTAFSSLNRHNANRFAWDWYSDHLAGRDVNGGPVELMPGNS